jgi:hypothetical protein
VTSLKDEGSCPELSLEETRDLFSIERSMVQSFRHDVRKLIYRIQCGLRLASDGLDASDFNLVGPGVQSALGLETGSYRMAASGADAGRRPRFRNGS